MKNLVLLLSMFIAVGTVSGQLSGFYQQGFEDLTFPPADWQRINELGSNQWTRRSDESHTGNASAFIAYQETAGLDWLITPQFTVAAGDSIVFWMKLDFHGYTPDSLSVLVSTTDSAIASFTNAVLLLKEGVNYPPNDNTWYPFGASLSAFVGQNIYIAFRHFNYNGDGLFLDDVYIGTLPAAEVEAFSIVLPSAAAVMPILPQAVFRNDGSATQSFNVTMEINPGGYTSQKTVTSLAPANYTLVEFDLWTPPAPGVYTAKVYSQLAGDAIPSNDTLQKIINIYNGFPNSGWSSRQVVSGGRWATGAVFNKPCTSDSDTGYLYLISGYDATYSSTQANSRFNITSGVWDAMATIPSARMQVTPVRCGNKIYVIGGYASSFSPLPTNFIYDISLNSWSTGAPMPTAVGDYAVVVYNDSLIYIIGGYTGSADINTVQVYHVNTDTWSTATSKPGLAVAGCRAGVSGNTIVFAGGYSQNASSSLSDSYKGIIDASNPDVIAWSPIAPYPAGTVGRHAGGAATEYNGRIYFAGGDPNGAGMNTLNFVCAYNTIADAWEIGPPMLHGVSNICTLTGVIDNDSLYLVTMGGYDGSNVTAYNEWLNLGPTQTIPYVTGDTTVCENNLVTLHAFNGLAYSWSPGSFLNDSTIAEPVATVAATTVFTVTISGQYGCPAVETVTVTIGSCDNDGDGYSIEQGDCDDNNASISPEALEICNDIDDNCDGLIDNITLIPPLKGVASLCAGYGSATAFDIDSVPGATYTWTVPAGLSIYSGQGTRHLVVSWTAAAIANGIQGTVCVSLNTSCGPYESCMDIDFQSRVPVTPASISGQSKLCPGDLPVFSTAYVARSSYFQWTLPSGITGSSNSNIIQAQVLAGYAGGIVSVSAGNACGTGGARSRTVMMNVPVIPPPISGPASGICNQSGVVYNCTPIIGTPEWSVTAGASIALGQGTSTVAIDFTGGYVTGTVSVAGVNACGTGPARSLTVKGAPATPGAVTGNITVCTNTTEHYSVQTVLGATNYTWTAPGTISLGQGSKEIDVAYGPTAATNQIITVKTSNACGTSPLRLLSNISMQYCIREVADENISGADIYPNPAKATATVHFIATFPEQYELTVLDVTGRVLYVQKGTASIGGNYLQLDVSTFRSGLYYVELATSSSKQQLKLVAE